MKKILFVSAMVCMTAVAFVACGKNDGNGAVDQFAGACSCSDGKGTDIFSKAELAQMGATCAELTDAPKGYYCTQL